MPDRRCRPFASERALCVMRVKRCTSIYACKSARSGLVAAASRTSKSTGATLGATSTASLAHPWTIADLAEEVGISRSALVERFTRYLSEPPMTYLTRWRLQLAVKSLERTSRGVADIAANVGYESEAAFSRAFKREFGEPPGRYRAHRKTLPAKAPVAS